MKKLAVCAVAGIAACALIGSYAWRSPVEPAAPRDGGSSVLDEPRASHPLLAEADQAILTDNVASLTSTASLQLAAVMQSVYEAGQVARERAELTIDYPQDRTIIPPDFLAPTFLWHESAPEADSWLIDISFPRESAHVLVLTPGRSPLQGEIDPRCIADTNEIYTPTAYQASAKSWTPSDDLWAVMKQLAVGAASIGISGFNSARPDRPVSHGEMTLTTSPDPVGAPIFYRDVPLAPSETKEGQIKPLSGDLVHVIAWRLRDISQRESRLVLTEVPTCTNCHSFSADGKTMGMDLDGPNDDKGTYVLAPVEKNMLVKSKDVISWNTFPGRLKDRQTIGFLSRVSPDGQYAVTTVNESLYTRNFKDYRFLQVFYPTRGILAYYSRATGEMKALPGADDPLYVHCAADWTPDGETLVFARAQARDPRPDDGVQAQHAGDPAEIPMQYDLYRLPFRGGQGGQPEPIAGASSNGMSNTFPKISPDGKWIVFVKCKNGQLMRPDGKLWIVPLSGGTAREMQCNTWRMNSWHSFSPNSRWLVFSSKANTPYTQMFLTHIDDQGNASPAILIPNSTAANRAVNLPEFVNIAYDDLVHIEMPALDYLEKGRRALLLAKQGQVEQAIAMFDETVKEQPDYYDGCMAAAVLVRCQGREDEAKTRLEALLRLNPRYLLARRELIKLLEKQGMQADAIAQYETGLEYNPDFHEARVALARWHIDHQDYGKATPHLKTLLDLDSKNTLRYVDLAGVLMRQGLREDAIKYLEKSLEIDPACVASHSALADAMIAQQKYALAVTHLQQALDADASATLTVKKLAWLLAACPEREVRNGARALLLAERACAADRYRNPDLLSTLAAAYAEVGLFADATKTATQASRLLDHQNESLANRIQQQLEHYANGKPFYLAGTEGTGG